MIKFVRYKYFYVSVITITMLTLHYNIYSSKNPRTYIGTQRKRTSYPKMLPIERRLPYNPYDSNSSDPYDPSKGSDPIFSPTISKQDINISINSTNTFSIVNKTHVARRIKKNDTISGNSKHSETNINSIYSDIFKKYFNYLHGINSKNNSGKGVTNIYRSAVNGLEVSPHPSTPVENQRHVSPQIRNLTSRPQTSAAQSNRSDVIEIKIDTSRRSVSPWPKEPSCNNFQTHFAKYRTLPRCALTSFPGSGNTWLRHLIEGATGIFTGSIYDDGQLYLWGYYGELDSWNAGTTIVQKTHSVSKKTIKSFGNRGILIMRNPYRAILSFHNYLFGGHQLFAPMVNYRRKDWQLFIQLQTKYWLETFINWIKQGEELLVIHYENIYQNPRVTIEKILHFLKVPIDSARFKCLQKNNFSVFKRPQEFFTESITLFTNKTRDKMDRAIRYVDYMLRKKGFDPPPLHLYEFFNHTSSEKIKLVPCLRNESTIACDARIDKLNFLKRRDAWKPSHLATEEGFSLNSTTLRQKNGIISRPAILKFEELGYKIASGIMKYIVKDPVNQMLRDNTTKKYLRRELPLEGNLGEEINKDLMFVI